MAISLRILLPYETQLQQNPMNMERVQPATTEIWENSQPDSLEKGSITVNKEDLVEPALETLQESLGRSIWKSSYTKYGN